MLYYLFRFLEQFGISGSRMWGYISFRSLLALILSLCISAWFGEWFIKYMKRRQITETARSEKIDPFGTQKTGVPTMGGIIIILAILVPVVLLGRLRNIYLILMIVTTVWLGLLGGMDDFIKIFRKNKEGLRGKYKIFGQISIGFIVGLTLWLSPDVCQRDLVLVPQTVSTATVGEAQQSGKTTYIYKEKEEKSLRTTIPFVKSHHLDYSAVMSFLGKYRTAGGWFLFVVMTILVVTAVSNSANLNDGMDGMCAGNSAIIGVALGILAYVSSHFQLAEYLNIMYIPGTEELVVFMCAFVGALIGFLWYNSYPAQVFMGDTGSLTIGGIIGVGAIIIHKELLLPILCGVFFVESLSVIVQVAFYKAGKRRGRKQRLFRRTPIHDAFRTQDSQLDPDCRYVFRGSGRVFHEAKITMRFLIVTVLLAALAIITLKIR